MRKIQLMLSIIIPYWQNRIYISESGFRQLILSLSFLLLFSASLRFLLKFTFEYNLRILEIHGISETGFLIANAHYSNAH
jgi:hypothetical protein